MNPARSVATNSYNFTNTVVDPVKVMGGIVCKAAVPIDKGLPNGPKKPSLCGLTTDTVAGAATGLVAIVAANLTADNSTSLPTGTTGGALDSLGSSITMPNNLIALPGVTSNVSTNPSSAGAVAHPRATSLTNKSCDSIVV